MAADGTVLWDQRLTYPWIHDVSVERLPKGNLILTGTHREGSLLAEWTVDGESLWLRLLPQIRVGAGRGSLLTTEDTIVAISGGITYQGEIMRTVVFEADLEGNTDRDVAAYELKPRPDGG